jgi:prepilin-type N-terminal cleavage/methylation domain-containing protein
MWNKRAFTLIEILIVIAIVALLAVITIPVFLKAQRESPAKLKGQCIENLARIEKAKGEIAAEMNLEQDATIDATNVFARLQGKVRCPADGEYTIGNVGVRPTCSIAGHVLP